MTRSRIKKIILGALVLLSFLLSFNLWFTGGQEDTENIQTASPSTASLVERSSEEVYAPYQTLIHGSASYFLRQNEVLDTYNEMIDSFVVNDIVNVEEMERESYYQLLSLSVDRWFEGVYSDNLPIGLLNTRFEDLPSDIANSGINRIAVNLDQQDNVFLYDSLNEIIYVAEVESINTEEMNELINNQDANIEEAIVQAVNNNYIYLPAERIEVEYRDYVVERLPNSLFIEEFFSDTSNVDVSSTEDETRYVDITTEVRIDNNEFVLYYLRQRQNTGELTLVERFSQSYGVLNRLENWTNEVHFQDYNPNDDSLTYQRYIDGIPIFDENHLESTIEINLVRSGLTDLKLPLRTIQTPLTIEGPDIKEMPSGYELISFINSIPEYSIENIDDVRLGLTWEDSEETDQVAHYESSWFVREGNEWHTLTQFVEDRGGTIDGF